MELLERLADELADFFDRLISEHSLEDGVGKTSDFGNDAVGKQLACNHSGDNERGRSSGSNSTRDSSSDSDGDLRTDRRCSSTDSCARATASHQGAQTCSSGWARDTRDNISPSRSQAAANPYSYSAAPCSIVALRRLFKHPALPNKTTKTEHRTKRLRALLLQKDCALLLNNELIHLCVEYRQCISGIVRVND